MRRTTVVTLVLIAALLVGTFFAPAEVGGFVVLSAVLLGLGVGLVAGGLGVGGAWLLVPLLILFFPVNIRLALGTALAAQIFITFTGSYEKFKTSHTGLPLAKPLIVGGLAGIPLGIWLNVNSSLHILTWIYVFVLFVMAVKTVTTFYRSGTGDDTHGRDFTADVLGKEEEDKVIDTVRAKLDKLGKPGEKMEEHVKEHVRDTYHGEEYEVDTLSLVLFGLLVGMLKSLVGVAGALIAPFLSGVMRVNVHAATTASIVTVAAISIPAAAGHALVGNVIYVLAGMVAVGGALGAVLGADINEYLPEKTLNVLLALMLMGLAYYMLPVKPF